MGIKNEKCQRCGHYIWKHESLKRGLGPVCAKIKWEEKALWWLKLKEIKYGQRKNQQRNHGEGV